MVSRIGESVVAHLAVWYDVVGPHQIKIVDLAARHELVISMVRVDSSAMVKLVLRHLETAVLVDLVVLDDVLIGHLFAGL